MRVTRAVSVRLIVVLRLLHAPLIQPVLQRVLTPVELVVEGKALLMILIYSTGYTVCGINPSYCCESTRSCVVTGASIICSVPVPPETCLRYILVCTFLTV